MNLLAFNDLVQRFAAAARASASGALDFTIGSIFRALAEANAAVALWLQWLIMVVLRQTRLATSQGVEVDSWVADWGMTRLPAVASLGQVTFSRYTPTLAAFVPVGTTVKTADGTQIFSVVADPTNGAYSATLGGYNLAAGVASVTVAAQAASAGTASNIQPGAIALIASAVAGVDTATNALAFTGGTDAESDTALRTRFALYVQGLSKGTLAAIGSAIAGVQQGLTFYVAQNQDTAGNLSPGNFVVTIDDGSGTPSAALQNAVYTAIDGVRAVGETFTVRPPAITPVTVSMTITAAPGYNKTLLMGPVATAVTAYINALTVGAPLLYTRVAQVAYSASPGVGSITGLVINGSQADVPVPVSGIIKAATVAVN